MSYVGYRRGDNAPVLSNLAVLYQLYKNTVGPLRMQKDDARMGSSGSWLCADKTRTFCAQPLDLYVQIINSKSHMVKPFAAFFNKFSDRAFRGGGLE